MLGDRGLYTQLTAQGISVSTKFDAAATVRQVRRGYHDEVHRLLGEQGIGNNGGNSISQLQYSFVMIP